MTLYVSLSATSWRCNCKDLLSCSDSVTHLDVQGADQPRSNSWERKDGNHGWMTPFLSPAFWRASRMAPAGDLCSTEPSPLTCSPACNLSSGGSHPPAPLFFILHLFGIAFQFKPAVYKPPHPYLSGSPLFFLNEHFKKWSESGASDSKEFACNIGELGSIPGQEDPLEKGMAIHSSICVRRTPWTEEPGRLQSTRLQRVGHNWMINTSFLSFLKISILLAALGLGCCARAFSSCAERGSSPSQCTSISCWRAQALGVWAR